VKLPFLILTATFTLKRCYPTNESFKKSHYNLVCDKDKSDE